MGLFKKKADPISERARALNAQIAALESKIKKLDVALESGAGPRWRSTAFPHGPTVNAQAERHREKTREPIFEEIDESRLKASAEPLITQEHFNEFGVRKYDLPALIEKIKKYA
jgi:hypothetical protein